MLGLWAFTNLEMAYAQLRVDERARTYVYASGANVAMTVDLHGRAGRRSPARARAACCSATSAPRRSSCSACGGCCAGALACACDWPDLRAMLRFGLPTVPADASVYALQVADRFYLFRAYSHAAAGHLRGRDASSRRSCSWRCAASSTPGRRSPTRSRATTRRRGCTRSSRPTTLLATGVVVVRRRAARALDRAAARARRSTSARTRALPWLALGWALYGLYLVFVVIAGRARVTSRNLPGRRRRPGRQRRAAARARAARRRRASASPARASRCAAPTWRCSLVMYLLTRGLFRVGFEWRRLAQLVGDPRRRRGLRRAAAADQRPRRALAARRRGWRWCRCCCCSRASSPPHERAQARALLADGRRRVAAFRAGHGEVEAYAEDPLRDV